MQNERQPKRLGKISGAFATALLLAACGSEVPATSQPTRTPESTPSPVPTLNVTPTPEVSPSPVVTPTPTVEATPSPTPTETAEPTPEPIAIADLVDQIVANGNENGWKNVSAQKVVDSINEAYDTDPEAATIINPYTNEPEKDFILGNPCFTPDMQSGSCVVMFGHLYWKGYVIDQNPLWLDSLSKLVQYVKKSIDPQDFDYFVSAVSTSENPF